MVTGSLYRDVDEEGRYSREVSAGTPMLQVYTDANGKLLILGKSGSGKTTLLHPTSRYREPVTISDRSRKPNARGIPEREGSRTPLIRYEHTRIQHRYAVASLLGICKCERHDLLVR